MKSSREAQRTARQLFRFCSEGGKFSDERARQVMEKLAGKSDIGVLESFARFVRLEKQRRHAIVESATTLDANTQSELLASLRARYGADVTAEFQTNPGLIGGLRVKLGSDVFDGSIRARLDSLTAAVTR
ncbi:MAG: FoF1 ATP synthase subunit delta [Verrucomicrobiales bacterium]